jgi:putative flippase GtrA
MILLIIRDVLAGKTAIMFARFLLVGVANTLFGLGTTYAMMYFLRVDAVPANAAGYAVGLLFSFTFNKRWTFSNRDRGAGSLLKFVLVIGAAYIVNLAVVLGAKDLFQVNPYVAQAMGIIPYTILSFLGCRYYVFKNAFR